MPSWSRFRRWVGAVTLGELLGFGGIPALGGVLVAAALAGVEDSVRAIALYVVAIVGGLGEGAVLGWFQQRVLVEWWPGLDRRRYVGHTAVAAAVAWGLGMLAPTLDDLVGLSLPVQIGLMVAAGLAILPSIGLAQARVLAEVTPRARGWVGVNVLGWLLGLPWTFVAPASVPDDAPLWAFVLAFALGGTLMGATVGVVTGLWLRREPERAGDGAAQGGAPHKPT